MEYIKGGEQHNDPVSWNLNILVSASQETVGNILRLDTYSDVNGGRDEMAVWIANRDDPITDTCGILMVTPDGSLMISHSEGNVILFSATPTTNLTAVLLDNGNFVLGELDTYGSVNRVLWQSFDYPTDTLLPGMKLGINLRTAHKWSLTSWVNDQVPASGSFTFGLDPNGTNQLIILWMVNVYWKSGPWPTGQFDFNYVSNEDEEYFIYTANGISGYTMSPSGLIQDRFEGNAKFGNCSNAIPDAGCVKQIARPSVRIIAGVLPMPQSIVTPELAVKFGGTARGKVREEMENVLNELGGQGVSGQYNNKQTAIARSSGMIYKFSALKL
ncbi:hypothetical protein FXO38_13563 [Capsicum annuum]|nr:hypothetical protein FXO38_13563 [Capsicum annuum]